LTDPASWLDTTEPVHASPFMEGMGVSVT